MDARGAMQRCPLWACSWTRIQAFHELHGRLKLAVGVDAASVMIQNSCNVHY